MKIKVLFLSFLMAFTLAGCSNTEDTESTTNQLLEQYEEEDYLLFVYEDDVDLSRFEAFATNLENIKIHTQDLENGSKGLIESNAISSSPTLLVINNGEIKERISDIDQIITYIETYDKEVPLSTKSEVNDAFSSKESFLLVLGYSTCYYCDYYKEQTLLRYEHSELPVKFMYVDHAFISQSDFDQFATAHAITYNASPTTYLVQDGVITASKEGYMKLNSLDAFITSHLNLDEEVSINELEDVQEAFAQEDTFMLVLGMSRCSYCVEYKNTTLKALINEHEGFSVMMIYSDHLTNHNELSQLLTHHQLTYEVSPTTYLIKEGEVEMTFKGYKTLDELYMYLADSSFSSYIE